MVCNSETSESEAEAAIGKNATDEEPAESESETGIPAEKETSTGLGLLGADRSDGDAADKEKC